MVIIRFVVAAVFLLLFRSVGYGQSSVIANERRIEDRIKALALTGDTAAGILKRVAFSAGDIAARKYIMGLMQSAGLSIRID